MSEEYFRGYSDAHNDLMVQIEEDIELIEQELDDIFEEYGNNDNKSADYKISRINNLQGQRRVINLMRLYLLINNDGKKGCSINAHIREVQ